MQNFRKNYAYRISLYLLLLTPIFFILAFLSKQQLHFSIIIFLFMLSIPVLFIVSLSLRFLSLNPLKHWLDIIFVSLGSFVLVGVLQDYFVGPICKRPYLSPPAPGTPPPLPHWTLDSIFDICSPYNFIELYKIASMLLTIGIILNIVFLISDIKRRKTVENMM